MQQPVDGQYQRGHPDAYNDIWRQAIAIGNAQGSASDSTQAEKVEVEPWQEAGPAMFPKVVSGYVAEEEIEDQVGDEEAVHFDMAWVEAMTLTLRNDS
jgi:hypothetical protein